MTCSGSSSQATPTVSMRRKPASSMSSLLFFSTSTRAMRWRARPTRHTLHDNAVSPLGLAAWMINHNTYIMAMISGILLHDEAEGPDPRREHAQQRRAMLVEQTQGSLRHASPGKTRPTSSTERAKGPPILGRSWSCPGRHRPSSLTKSARRRRVRRRGPIPGSIHYIPLDEGRHFAASEPARAPLRRVRTGSRGSARQPPSVGLRIP